MIGGLIDSVVGLATNNRDYNRAVNNFDRNMEWQREYASKKYQMMTADMKKAGLHPSLAAGANPGSANVVSSNLPGQANTNFAAVQAAYEAKKINNAQVKLAESQASYYEAMAEDVRGASNNPVPGQNPVAGVALQDLSTPTKHTKSPDTGVTITSPEGYTVNVTPGVREYLQDLEDKYGMEEAKEIVGSYYYLKDMTVQQLRDREARYNALAKRSRYSRRQKRSKQYTPTLTIQKRSRLGGR